MKTAAGRRGSEPVLSAEQTTPLSGLRSDFPILATKVRGKPLVYLDSAATSQKPRQVIEAVSDFYASSNANIHRGVHYLGERATLAYEGAREKVARFLGASGADEIVFTRGTTESLNLVAQAWGRSNVGPGDEVLITGMEHHSNIVPWQLLCEATGATLRAVPVTDAGALDLDGLERLLGPRTRLFAFAHVSNVLGTINPVAQLVARARAVGAVTVVDGAQAVPHLPVDVQSLGCDFFAFSGHKVLGPTGIGVLYGRRDLLGQMPPWQGGGSMIASVSLERSSFAPPPARFEAGTPAIAEAVGLGVALEYLQAAGLEEVGAWESELLAYATENLSRLPWIRIIGTTPEKTGVLSLVVDGVHPHDVSAVLDDEGIAVRAGHHCAQPLMDRFKVPATVRASFALYNTMDDVDQLVSGLERVRKVFG